MKLALNRRGLVPSHYADASTHTPIQKDQPNSQNCIQPSVTGKRILRLPQVINKTGVPRSSIYANIKNRKFPPPIRLGIRCVGWIEDEIDQWIFMRMEATRG